MKNEGGDGSPSRPIEQPGGRLGEASLPTNPTFHHASYLPFGLCSTCPIAGLSTTGVNDPDYTDSIVSCLADR